MGHLLQYTIGLSFVIILMCLKTSNAIKCYQCNSYDDKRCLGDDNNKLNEELVHDCGKTTEGKNYTLCRKIKQVIDFEVNGLKPENRVIRTCGWDDSSYKDKCYQRSGFGGRQEVCACEKDGCNGSPALYASAALVLSLLALQRIHL